ncbi:MAG TPA: hypothetical protein P5243_10935, partial [Bacteroidales bacterium]|nr:hypothetical protein [Bacteroidales bacterium]
NAVSGVVNIITKKPVTSQGLDVHAHTGTFNTKKIQTGYGYYNAQQDVGVRVSAQKKYTEKGNFGGSQGLFNWSDSVYNFENDISVDAKITYKSLTFGTNYLQKQSSVNLYYRTVGTAFKEGESLWNIGFLNSYITYDIKPTAKTIFTHNTYYRNTTLYPNTIAYITDTAQLRCFRPNYLIGTELIGKQQITDNLKCINGIALEHENLAKTYGETWSNSSEETPPRPPKPPLLQNYSANAFVQFSYTIFDQLEFTAGNRFDYNSSYKFVYTPNGSIMFHANRYNIKLLYMEAFRAPKPWDYNWGVGNSHLQPEEIHSLELNSNFSITPHLLFETSVYKNRMYNMLVKNKTNTAWTNADTINLIGIETELQYLRKVYQAYINYTYTYFYDKPDNRIEEIAPHTCN